jgi:hypothetical protein
MSIEELSELILKCLPSACRIDIRYEDGGVDPYLLDAESEDVIFVPMYDSPLERKVKDCLLEADRYAQGEKSKVIKLNSG